MSQISSITKGPRQSNIELLRIIAMFFVLVVHADFWALGGPSADDFTNETLNAWTRIFFESVSIVCVNVFILISGWFGIRFSAKGFCNFIFQCAYFLFGIYIVMLSFGFVDFSIKGIAGCMCLTQANWFIRTYAALYILAPVLNAFIEKTTQSQFKIILILFFIFQTVWGWSGAAVWIANGYSIFSFIGLYLLARYTRTYGIPVINKRGGIIYLFSVIANSIGYWIFKQLGIPIDIYAYINPLVIIGSLGLLIFFSNLKLSYSKFINWVAASAFAAFLLHSNPNIGVPIFKETIMSIYSSNTGIDVILMITTYLICVFILAIIIDQPRKWLWNYISKLFSK